jgi:hypothetical protein
MMELIIESLALLAGDNLISLNVSLIVTEFYVVKYLNSSNAFHPY